MQAKILLAALIALAFTASPAAADSFTVDGMTADTYGTPTNGRVFMFHAMHGTRARSEFPELVDGWVARGYQVVMPDEPYDHDPQLSQSKALRAAFLVDSTEGGTYRDRWATYTHDLIAQANTLYGSVSRLIMAGQSWGGFSALLAACQNPEVDAYEVTIPLTDPNTYAPFSDVPLANLKLDSCVTRLRAIPGFIAWGDADTIVGPTATRSLVGRLGPYAVTSCEYAKLVHVSSSLTYQGMLRWTDGARNCLPWPAVASAPAVAPTMAVEAPVASSAAQPAVVPAPKPRARCNRSTRCESVVRRGKLFHVYNRRSKHPRWVYVRKAAKTCRCSR